MIWWHGKSSDDVHVIVERCPDVIVPSRKHEKISITGRSGDLLVEQDAYENVLQRYEIYVSAEAPRLPTISHTVVEWLMVKGYQRLEDSYWLDTFRMASYTGGTEIANILNRYGRATIEFDCKPQRFYKSGDFFIDVEQGMHHCNGAEDGECGSTADKRVVQPQGHYHLGNYPEERMVEDKHPKNSEQVEESVSGGGSPCRDVGYRCCHVGGKGGSYVFPEHQRGTKFKVQAVGAHHQRKGHCGGRRLEHNGYNGSDEYAYQHAPEPEPAPSVDKFLDLLQYGRIY